MPDDESSLGTEVDETNPTDGWDPDDEEAFDDDFVDVDIMEASATIFGSVRCDEFGAVGSLIGSAAVAGDAEIATSTMGAVSADGAALHQSGAAVMVVSGDAAISQGGAVVVVARQAEIETGAACCVVTGEASVARSWVGLMAARNATVSDDSHVIIDAKAGLIIGAFLFGGLGALAVATYFGARRVADRMPALSHHPHMRAMSHMGAMSRMGGMPHMKRMWHMAGARMARTPDLPKMPGLSAVGDAISRLRHAG